MKEHGVALRVGVPFADRFQVGASYFHGFTQLFDRDVAGPFAMLGFTPHFYLLSEIDLQKIYPAGQLSSQTGWVTWNRLDYEFIQGLHGYLTYELTRADFQASGQQSSAWGVGSQWFPRPHFELDLRCRFQSVPAFPNDTLEYVTLLLHYYL